jgi:hypothetical protein
VPGIARLGPDPLAEDFTLPRFAALLDGGRRQIKGVLRDQGTIAGIGNAYSDAIERSRGLPLRDLKAEKKSGLRVHGRTGEPCPVCGGHHPRGVLQRLLAAVLPHLPDRRQAPRRPPAVPSAQVTRAPTPGRRQRLVARRTTNLGLDAIVTQVPKRRRSVTW